VPPKYDGAAHRRRRSRGAFHALSLTHPTGRGGARHVRRAAGRAGGGPAGGQPFHAFVLTRGMATMSVDVLDSRVTPSRFAALSKQLGAGFGRIEPALRNRTGARTTVSRPTFDGGAVVWHRHSEQSIIAEPDASAGGPFVRGVGLRGSGRVRQHTEFPRVVRANVTARVPTNPATDPFRVFGVEILTLSDAERLPE
jgi:hypothetical protein